ncbi:carbon-nitrogen hydrolase family protein [Azospirillum doebereinerae]|uniref:Carbon-nitrogen hydrolase family protein n=1 Tax=Azospirillum doebereinerae TaxID=92933 RepID=A0A433J1V1_9PROT|nr:carbon-nitrogen hydrolase family protein [Azospirillum doebereinerae]MCG5242003.1 carbon-nitrogen hydrolase family protein [Azospirillum doebereinerae]RUQ65077.1 carbon-nitrogen hydrolase family protein [Azospirillum doebereinerae]
MSGVLKAACVQVNAGTELEANLASAGDLVRRARDAGADFITLPENVGWMVQGRAKIMARVRGEAEHPGVAFFAGLARETGAWILSGTLHVLLDGERVANRSYLFDPQGRAVAHYDKIHMFDVDLKGGESYRESATFRPGERAVVAGTPWGGVGLTICYDVRFPYLHRALAKAGASILTAPAAFTVPTGRAHWHTLLRARAIETGCFVVAAAQTGTHDEGRQTYGHSLIVAPWGEVLADAGEEVGFVVAELDMARVEEARRMVPALTHDRDFEVVRTGF